MGSIRTNEAATRLQTGACSSVEAVVGIGTGAGSDYPSACASTHYFTYDLTTASANTFSVVATRCTTGGKTPNYTSAQTITLNTNFDNGYDAWVLTAPY